MEERRNIPSTELNVLVNCILKAKARSKNLRQNGICLITEEALEVGSHLYLVISLSDAKETEAYGKVVWSKRVDLKSYESGIEFWHIEEMDTEKISKYLNNLIME